MRYHRIFTGTIIVFCLFNIPHFLFAEDVSIHQANLNFVERITRFEEGQKAIVNEMRTRFQAVDKRFEIMDKRFEEGQKAIANEMKTRFEVMDKRFEVLDKRFEEGQKAIVNEMRTRFQAVDKRFEILEKSIDERFESFNQRFESLVREMNQRFESFEKRLSTLENQMTGLSTFIFTMLSTVIALIIGLIGFIVWDRKSVFDKMEKLFQSHVETYHAPEPVVIKEKESHAEGNPQHSDIVDQLTNEGYQISKNMQEKIRDVYNFFNQFPEMRPVLNTV